MQFQIVYNPNAGRGKAKEALPLLEYQLRKAGRQYVIHESDELDFISDQLTGIGEEDVIVALGGDGTVNTLIPFLLRHTNPLGIIPAGMINNLARAAGIARKVPEAVRTLLTGRSKCVDVGCINDKVYFINGMGVGFDGQVNLEGNEIQSMTGQKVHIVAIARALRNYQPTQVQIQMNDHVFDASIFQLAIGNSPYMGGGFKLTPEALMDDGVLDVAMVEPLRKGRIVRNIRKLRNGKVGVLNEIHLDRTKQLTFTSVASMPVHYDGEVYQPLDRQIRVAVIPAAVKLIGDWQY